MKPTVATGDERRLIRIHSDFAFPQQAEETATSDEDSDTGMEGLCFGEQTDEMRVRNQEYFATHVGGFTTILQESIAGNGRQIQTIINPTLSKMSSCCLHPNMYTNIQPIPLLSQMAQILGTDPSWEERFTNSVECNSAVRDAFRALCSSWDHEPTIHCRLMDLVSYISVALGIRLLASSEKKLAIGGMLVREEFDMCGKSDPYFENSDGQPVLCSAVKTNTSFPTGRHWHRECRASQILGCMYAHSCPAALVTPAQFKFFFESGERDTVFTFPADQNPAASLFLNASLMGAMGRDFLRAICICLLSPRASCAQEDASDVGAQWTIKTPKIRRPLKRLENSAEKASKKCDDKQSSQQKANPAAKVRAPTFLSGYHDGRPVNAKIRVASDEAAHAIWELKRQQDAAAAMSGAADPGHGRQAVAATSPLDHSLQLSCQADFALGL